MSTVDVMSERCDECGEVLEIGSWPFCPDHGQPYLAKGFEPFYDPGLDAVITGAGDRNKLMRPHWENDHIVRIEGRSKPESYWRELRDRREARREASMKEKS